MRLECSIKMAGIGIIEAHSIQNNQYLLECSASQNDVTLRAHWSPRLNFNARHIPQEVVDAMDGKVLKIFTFDNRNIPACLGCAFFNQRRSNGNRIQRNFLCLDYLGNNEQEKKESRFNKGGSVMWGHS